MTLASVSKSILNIFARFIYFLSKHSRKIVAAYKLLHVYIYSYYLCAKFNCKDIIFKGSVREIRGEKYIRIGKGTKFGFSVVLAAHDSYGPDIFSPEVIIGDNCNFGDYLHLTCINKIIIGKGVLTGRYVTITDNGHGRVEECIHDIAPEHRRLYSKGPTMIGDNVWIGDKVTICPGVSIGKGCVIAANAVVTHSIPPFTLAAGNPARAIRTFDFPETNIEKCH